MIRVNPHHTGSDRTPEMDGVTPDSCHEESCGDNPQLECGWIFYRTATTITKCEKPRGHNGPHVGHAARIT